MGVPFARRSGVPFNPETAEFPVKFPVSREFAWRLVRIPLRRQPDILVFREFSLLDEKGLRNAGFSHRQ
jgi:hypothetical protein